MEGVHREDVVAAVVAAAKLHKFKDGMSNEFTEWETGNMRNKRQGIIVWFQHRKNIKHIERHGNLLYVSKRMRYAVLYVNQNVIEEVVNTRLKLPFISKIDLS